MSFTGLDFYNRLNELCSKNGTTITAFLVSAGKSQSAGTYMKKKSAPDSKLVALASERFGVSTEWLLGLTDNPVVAQNGSGYVLDKREAKLIEGLRAADEPTRNIVYSVAQAALASSADNVTMAPAPVFLPPKGGISRQGKRRFTPHTGLKRIDGNAAAGPPITAAPETDRAARVPDKYLSPRYFLVRARGDSMVGANIDDGDLCVFDRDAYRDEGAIMLVQVDGLTDQPDVTIKRVFFHPGTDPDGEDAEIELRSANPAYRPMFYPAHEASISGVLVDILTPAADV